MKLSLKFLLCTISICFWFIGQAWALSLGSLEVISNATQPFEAKINIKVADSEIADLKNLQVSEADSSVYEKLGISRSGSKKELLVKLVRNSNGAPEYLHLTSKLPLDADKGLFQDIVVELKWQSGLIRRVYTLLSDKTISVADGQTLGDIASRFKPEVGASSFNQTLIALYRSNPQAFVAGNIHRLKVGEVLHVPSDAMIKSIPVDESNNLVSLSNKNYESGLLNRSTEDLASTKNSDFVANKKEANDRLNIGSSTGDSAVDQQLANQIEELVAQEKLLADAKQRIAEIERNIADLKKVSEKSKGATFSIASQSVLKLVLSLLLMLAVSAITYWALKKKVRNNFSSNRAEEVVPKDINSPLENDPVAIKDVLYSPEKTKALFAGIDLNLDAPLKSIAQTKKITPAELRVKLNLAKSYLKIDDLVMAKLILDEILLADNSKSEEISKEARHLRSKITI